MVRERNAKLKSGLPLSDASNANPDSDSSVNRRSDLNGEAPSRKPGQQQRSFWTLLKKFLHLIRQHLPSIGMGLVLLTVAIALRLVPPYGTKLAIDCVLT